MTYTVFNNRFRTSPIVFHHPGRIGKDCLNDLSEIVALKRLAFARMSREVNLGTFVDRKEKIELPIPALASQKVEPFLEAQLSIVFVSNLAEKGSMPRCLDYFGVYYSTLQCPTNAWANVLKIGRIRSYLQTVQTPYVAFFDSDDVFITAHPRHILDRFLSDFNCEMLVMGGEVLWPPAFKEGSNRQYSHFLETVPEAASSDHVYLNSGGWIARTDFARRFFDELETVAFHDFPNDDQPRFWILYSKYYPEILIDYRCQIFQCEFSKEISLEHGRAPSEELKLLCP